MTAVSLLFSITRFKPKSFERWDELMRRWMNRKLSFHPRAETVLEHPNSSSITHNKRTNRHGRLYGVTMQDHGVSQNCPAIKFHQIR